MIDQINGLGIETVELGYAITSDQADSIRDMVKQDRVHVSSVHNYCPVPTGVSTGHPEHFLFDGATASERRMAVQYTVHSLSLAKDVGASAVVVHAARVKTCRTTSKLIDLAKAGKQGTRAWHRMFNKTLARREKKAVIHMDELRRTLDKLLPHFVEAGVALALENLPSWDAMPNESEMLLLCNEYKSPALRYWHDMGHGEVRANLGFIHHKHWVEKLLPHTAGTHIHDVVYPADDHLMPPVGQLKFKDFACFASPDILRVLEPAPGTPAHAVIEGLKCVRKAWEATTTPEEIMNIIPSSSRGV